MPAESPHQTEFVQPGSQSLPSLENEQNSISLLSILRVLKLGKRTILTAMCILFVLATIVAFVLPPQYTSVAAVIPPTSSGNSAAALAGQLSALAAGNLLGGASPKSPPDLYAGML